jgi:flagellin-like hook-associated protein FlgL
MLSVNVNPAASRSGLSLAKSTDALSASLQRLSSGRRIVNPSDDAGGLAVSMKMKAAIRRTEATGINLRNIQSYLEVQEGSFKVADGVLSRMSELTALSRDVTKNPGDIENYDKEFGNLKLQMKSLSTEKFNGVAIFNNKNVKGATIEVPTSEDGSQLTTLTQAPLNSDPMLNMMTNGYKKFGIQSRIFFAERINDEAEIFPNGPSSSQTVKNIYTLPGGESHTLSINADPIAEPTSPTATTGTAGASSYTYTFGLNYDLDGVKYTENLPLVYPANLNKAVDDITKPIYEGGSPKVDAYGYPEYMPLDDKQKPVPDVDAPPASPGAVSNIVGSVNTSATPPIFSYTTPNSYVAGQPIGFYENGNTSSVVWYQPQTEIYEGAGGTVSQQAYEDVKGVPPYIWRDVKLPGAGVDNPVGEMRWFNTATGQYTRNLPAGGSSPQNGAAPSSPPNFGYGQPFTPPQYSATNPTQETEQGNAWVHRLLSGRINGVGSDNLANSSTHNTNLLAQNAADYSSISQLALQQLADMRAQNGSETSRVGFSEDMLKVNAVNLEAADSRIIDVDIASESSQLARFQILQQAGTAMLAQANASHQALLKLLQG